MKSVFLAIYVLVAAAIFCHFVHSWYTDSENGISFSELFLAVVLALAWPIPAPFWIWFKIDNYVWNKKHGRYA